jgi:PRC-barrel domain
MLNIEQIEEWIGQEVVDVDGERVGKLDEVYYSTVTDEAIFAVVKSGLLGRHTSLIPLAGASAGRDYLRLAYSAAQIDDVGFELDAGATIGQGDGQRLGAAYGIDVPPEDFASASSIEERRRAAGEAAARAGELDEEARRRAAEAEDARGAADDAADAAFQKTDDAERARVEAERAREQARRIAPN